MFCTSSCTSQICIALHGVLKHVLQFLGALYAVQATKPFIDPVTHKKIVFIDNQNTTSMPQHFHMESIEQCMGGSLTPEQAFSLRQYRAEMEAEDARRHEAAGSL